MQTAVWGRRRKHWWTVESTLSLMEGGNPFDQVAPGLRASQNAVPGHSVAQWWSLPCVRAHVPCPRTRVLPVASLSCACSAPRPLRTASLPAQHSRSSQVDKPCGGKSPGPRPAPSTAPTRSPRKTDMVAASMTHLCPARSSVPGRPQGDSHRVGVSLQGSMRPVGLRSPARPLPLPWPLL